MKVHIKQKKKNFTMISNVIAQDINISLKAKGMSLIIAHFPDDWHFYEEKLQDYTSDGKTAISNALKELEVGGYLFRKQLREKGRFSNKLWIFSDEKLSTEDLQDFPEIRKTDIGKNDNGKTVTTNTHSNNITENNKKNTQKNGRKKAFYKFVNVLKSNAELYSGLYIEFENKIYCFENINGQLLLKDKISDLILSKVQAEKIYQKMHKSFDVKIVRGNK